MSVDSHDRKTERIRKFWNSQAREHQTDLAATSPDPLAKDLEVAALVRHLDPERDTLEVGCGNGVNIIRLLDYLRRRVVGVDYAESMIDAAQQALDGHPESARVQFKVATLLGNLREIGVFPQIFTVRCLINLPSFDLQVQAMETFADALEPGGRLVLIESVQQGQEKLNDLRESVGLRRTPYHWHNLYLDEPKFLARVPATLSLVEIDNFASLYFVISRVFNAKLTPTGEEPDYLAEINKIATRLPSFGDCGPPKLFCFEKLS